jgi:hypothetical protein
MPCNSKHPNGLYGVHRTRIEAALTGSAAEAAASANLTKTEASVTAVER